MMYYDGYGWPFMATGWGFMVIFWVLIIIWIIYFVKLFDNNKSNENNWDNALNILRERYAKWEIDKKQFEDMKNNLSK